MTDGPGRTGGLRISDPKVMRALAHPARIEIVEYLNSSGASVTATEMADMVELSPSASSYHLRELAKFGLVEHAPSQGDGRERRWRATSSGVQIDGVAGEPETQAAERALVDLYLSRDMARVEEWLDRQGEEPPEWRNASAMMGQILLVSAAELAALNQQVRALMEPYRMRMRGEGEVPEGARQVRALYLAFPAESFDEESIS
jgi:DNA-binding transcriptional ArsR family regulator